MKHQSGIYKIQSIIKPERVYIGSSVDILKRWGGHLNRLKRGVHDNAKLQAHYDKYGKGDLQFSILLGCDKESLVTNEQFFIDTYKSWFNLCPTAGSPLGRKASEESKRKMSIAKLGKKQSKETIEKRRLSIGDPWNKGKKMTIELRLKLSKAHQGKPSPIKGRKGFRLGHPVSLETREKLRKAHTGKKMSLEQRKKLSEVNRGKPGHPCSEETKKKISAFHKGKKWGIGRKCSEETKRRIGDANRGRKLPPMSEEAKRKISLSLLGNKRGMGNKNNKKAFPSEETRQKMSESGKEVWRLKKLKEQIIDQSPSLCN